VPVLHACAVELLHQLAFLLLRHLLLFVVVRTGSAMTIPISAVPVCCCSYGLDLFLLSIDEGISGYRDDSLETVKRNEQTYGIPLKVCAPSGWPGLCTCTAVAAVMFCSNVAAAVQPARRQQPPILSACGSIGVTAAVKQAPANQILVLAAAGLAAAATHK
jgi:hypothetical protein